MNVTMFFAIFSVMTVFYFLVGWHASKDISSTDDYFLAGRNLTAPVITATLLATQIGGGMFLGTAQDPIRGSFYNLGMALGFLVLGFGIAAKLRNFNVSTIGQIFETSYGSHHLKNVASLLGVASMCGILTGQIISAKSIILGFTGISSGLIFILFWSFVIAYTIIGGFKAVVKTDAAQVMVIITVFSITCIYSLIAHPTSLFSPDFMPMVKNLWDTTDMSWVQGLRLLLLPILFSLIEQDLSQRFFAAKDGRTAKKAALAASAALTVFAFVPFYFGMQPYLLHLTINSAISPLLPALEFLTNDFFFSICLCAIIAAITSTSDSLLCAISSIASGFAHDAIPSVSRLTLSKITTIVFGIGTLIASFYMPQSIIGILTDSYELSVCCMIVPLMFAFFKNKLYPKAAFFGVYGGLSMFVFLRLLNNPFIEPWILFIGVGFSLVCFLIGQFTSDEQSAILRVRTGNE